MDALSLLLVISAAVIHATWNLLAKRASGGPLFVWSYSLVTAIVYLPLVAWLLAHSQASWSIMMVGFVVLSGLLHLGYSIALQTGYQRADLSIVYPVARGTGPALSVAGAIVFLGEPLSFGKGLGSALVIAGVLALGLNFKRGSTGWIGGIGWGGFTGLFIASYTVVDGAAVKLLAISPLILDYFGNLVRLATLTPHAIGQRDRWHAAWRQYGGISIACGFLVPLSYVLVLYAMTRADVSVIAPARELSMMVGVLFAWWFLGEKDLGRRLAAALCIGAGVAVLAHG